jgi:hypothetical protein
MPGSLYRKGRGKEARVCHMGHLLMENRNGLIVDALVTPTTGTGGTKPLPLLACGTVVGLRPRAGSGRLVSIPELCSRQSPSSTVWEHRAEGIPMPRPLFVPARDARKVEVFGADIYLTMPRQRGGRR